jgi:hypothetical protein
MANDSHNHSALLEALIGSLIIGGTLFLSMRKDGDKESFEKIDALKEELQDLLNKANKKTRSIKSEIGEKAEEYTHRIEDYADQIKNLLESMSSDHKEKVIPFLIGGALGSILGALFVSYFHSQAETKNVKQSHPLTSLIHGIIEVLEEKKRSESPPENKNDYLDLLAEGIKLCQMVKKIM